jgi:hypothetical protein
LVSEHRSLAYENQRPYGRGNPSIEGLKGHVQQLQADMVTKADLTILRAEARANLQAAMQQNEVEIRQMIQAMLSNHVGISGGRQEQWDSSRSKGSRPNYGENSGHSHHTFGNGGNTNQDGSGFEDGFKPKIVRLEFSRFDGEDPKTWCCRAEQFFNHYGTPDA